LEKLVDDGRIISKYNLKKKVAKRLHVICSSVTLVAFVNVLAALMSVARMVRNFWTG
jgi:hypothetical protein